MTKDIREKLRTCDPCQRYARSHKQDPVEVSHSNMFNIFPGHTLHLDFAEYNNKDYLLLVDRLTGYIACENTVNQGTEAAILAVKNWANRFGFPYKIISDSGGGLKSTFIKQLRLLGVKHTHSSAYHPQSNSLAERAVQSLIGSLKKSSERLTKLHLDEIVFGINSTTSQEATGSANDRFMGRSTRTLLPNSYNPELKPGELI